MPIQVYYRWPPMPKPWVRFIEPASAAKTLHIIKIKTHSSCEIEHFKVLFCRVLTKRTEGIYPGYYPPKILCKICRTFLPVPGTSGSSVRHSYPYQKLLEVLYARAHNTRNFWKFCNNPVPLPGTSVSSVRLWHYTPGTGIRL